MNSKNKPKKLKNPKIEENMKKITQTTSFLSKLCQIDELNFGSFIQISDFFQFFQDSLLTLGHLQPFYHLYHSLSWLDTSQKPKILKKFAICLKWLKETSISRMKLLTSDPNIGKINKSVRIVTNINAKNIERQKEMMKKVHAQHSTFAEEHLGINDEILNSHLSDFDLPPVLISSSQQLNTILEDICKEFGLISNLDQDDGHTITYQITYLFPQLFDIQKHKSEWIPYGDTAAKDLHKKKLQKLPNKLTKISNIKKKSSSSEIEEFIKVEYKVICIKECDWKIRNKVDVFAWEKKQESRIRSVLKNDALLENSFHMLAIQNFNAQVKLLEEFSMIYPEKTTKKGRLRRELGESQSEIKSKYLMGLLNDKASSQLTENDAILLSTYNIKSVYTLKLLKSRDLKNRIIQMLNVFKSFDKLFVLDLELIERIRTENFEKLRFEFKEDLIENLENEFFVKDSKDEYIIYDSALDEYMTIENWLILLGTFYIEKHELVLDHHSNQYPPIDRDFLMAELLEEENKFLLSKLQLVFVLVKIYKAIVDVKAVKKLIDLISRILWMRPRLNLTNSYFAQSYWAHCAAIKAQQGFFTVFLSTFISKDPHVNLGLNKAVKIIELVNNLLEDLTLDLKIFCPKEKSLLESVIWEEGTIILQNLPKTNGIELNWGDFEQGLRVAVEDSVKGKLKSSDENLIGYKDLCINLWTLSHGYQSLLKTNWQIKTLKTIYSSQLYQAKKSEVGPLLPITPSQQIQSPHFFYIFELFPELSSFFNFSQTSSVYSLVSGSALPLFYLIEYYEIWNKQFLQIAIQVNSTLTDPFVMNITELEIAQELSFIFRNSKVNWMLILGRKGEGIILEKVQQEIKRLNNRIQTCNGFMDIMKIKIAKRDEYNEGEVKVDYFMSIDWFCEDLKSILYRNAKCCQILKIIKEIYRILALVPEKSLEKALTRTSVKGLVSSYQVNLNTLDYYSDLVLSILNNSENVSFDLDDLLQNLFGLLRYTQIIISTNLLKFKKIQVLELNELGTIEKPVHPEDSEEVLTEDSPDSPEISSLLDKFAIILSIKTNDWTSNFNQIFYLFANTLNHIIDLFLRKLNDTETQVMKKTLAELYGFNVGAGGIGPYSNSIISVCEIFKLNHKISNFPGRIVGGFLDVLELGFLDLTDKSREKFYKFFENSLNTETNTKKEKIGNRLRINLLKGIFIEYKTAQSNYFITYSDSLRRYDDFIEDLDGEDPDFSHISILKNYFIEEICLFGVKELENLFENYHFGNIFQSNSFFSCNFDHIEHDSASKMGALQRFINEIRNRSSRVETPTGGYALVFFIKDLTASIRKLTECYLTYNEPQFWSQLELSKLQLEFLTTKFSAVDSQASVFADEAEKILKNFDNIVNLTVTQKGSEIIYNLDSIRRQLKEIEENTKQLENLTRIIVDNEFRDRLETKDREIRDFLQNFKSFQEEIAQSVKNDLEINVSEGIFSVMPYSSKIKRKKIGQILQGTQENVKERKKNELNRLKGELIRIRVFNRFAKLFNKEKVDKEVVSLKEQLASNQVIWEELNHTQRRETILKQELATAQAVLSTSEKNIEKLQKDIEEINSQRLRLQMFRENKLRQGQELKEMIKVEKQSKEKQKKLVELMKDQVKIKDLQENEFEAGQEFLSLLEDYENEIKKLKIELEGVREEKEKAFFGLEELRREIDLRNEGGNWKEKYLTLSRNLTDSSSRSFAMSSSKTPIKMNESYNQLSFKSKSPTLPKIGDKGSFRAL